MIFFVEEIKTPKSSTNNTETTCDNKGQDNQAFELTESGNNQKVQKTTTTTVNRNPIDNPDTAINNTKKSKNCLMEFFDPTLAYDCLKVFFKKREHNGRLFLILLVCSYFLFIGPTLGKLFL